MYCRTVEVKWWKEAELLVHASQSIEDTQVIVGFDGSHLCHRTQNVETRTKGEG